MFSSIPSRARSHRSRTRDAHGPSQPHLRLPELRRRLRPLAGQVRRLRRVEHDRRGRRRRRPRGAAGPAARRARAALFALEPLAGETHDAPRLPSGIAEFDRVTGGGFVRGSVLLLGGDPGIGKSTLLIQVAAALARAGQRVGLHLGRGSGGAGAAARRAARRSPARRSSSRPRPRSRTSSRRCREGKTPRLVVIDSIQTMWTDAVESAPGTVTQVRGSAQALIRFAKTLRRRASSWSATSPRTARSPARAWSSTWSMRCCRSRAKARTSSASCAR